MTVHPVRPPGGCPPAPRRPPRGDSAGLGPDIDPDTTTYAELAALVDERAAELGPTRRLVLLEAGNDVETVVTYLAALAGRHPVLLTAPGDVERHAHLLDHYLPDVVQASGRRLEEVRPGTAHDLHPDLAVLLSTSGSTGSPKLVTALARQRRRQRPQHRRPTSASATPTAR